MQKALSTVIIALSAATVLSAGPAAPPTTPPALSVKAARALGPGATVTVRGVVLNGPELGGLRFVQDGESGLALYALPNRVAGYDELRPGDSLVATGQLKNYNGLLEMDPISSVRKLSGSRPLHPLRVPAAAMSSAFAEANEGRLVEVSGLTKLTSPAGAPAETLLANTNYLLDGQSGVLMRVHNASTGPNGLVDSAVPKGEAFDVRGIMGQFSASGTDGYQLLPRLSTDIIRGGGLPAIMAEPVPININSQGFTLEFTTRYPGDTRVSYGSAADAMTEEKVEAGFTTQHHLVLDGLEPGTTYYVRVSSQNAAGTARAEAVPIITGGKKGKRK